MSWAPYRLVGVGVAGIERGDDGRDWDGEEVRMVDERDELSCAMLSKWNLPVSWRDIPHQCKRGRRQSYREHGDILCSCPQVRLGRAVLHHTEDLYDIAGI